FLFAIIDNLLVLTLVIALSALTASSQAHQPDCSDHINGLSFADPVSCSSYYICLRGRALRRECGHGLFFDPRTQICNLPRLVECHNGDRTPCVTTTKEPCTTPTTPCTTTKEPCTTTPCTTTKEPCTTTPCTTTAAPCTTTPCATSENPIIVKIVDKVVSSPAEALVSLRDCQGIEDGTIFTNARHCRRFYVCRNNRVRHQVCPGGQWFDRELKICRNQREVTNCFAGRN
ncbi:hypothetical protein KR044_012669, partial [Drosophila immigrans]